MMNESLFKSKDKQYFQPEKGEKPPKGVSVKVGPREGHYFKTTTKNIIWIKPKGTKTLSGKPIPPNWINVRVSADKKSDIQAVGKDTKGRSVYLYSAVSEKRSQAIKFKRLKVFTKSYSKLIEQINKDFNSFEEAKILYLISKTAFRIGSNTETQAKVKAYGASTLKCSHIKINGDVIKFDFVGKKGIRIKKSIKDSKLASIFSKICKIKDSKLFNSTNNDVRKYLHSISSKFTIKDFRTYIATDIAKKEIKKYPYPKDEKSFKKYVKEIATKVSNFLGNTPSVCLKAYIAPEIFASWISEYPDALKVFQKSEISMQDFVDTIFYDEEVDINEVQTPFDDEEDDKYEENVDEFLEKSKIYFYPGKGQRIPYGKIIQEGPRKGKYYESEQKYRYEDIKIYDEIRNKIGIDYIIKREHTEKDINGNSTTK